MQSVIPTAPGPTYVLWYVLASILGMLLGGSGVAGLIALIQNRKKPAADIHESEARTAKSFAEVRSLELQSNISAGDAVLRMVQQLTFAQVTIDRLHEENERLTSENEVYETQTRKAKALLKLHGINLDDNI